MVVITLSGRTTRGQFPFVDVSVSCATWTKIQAFTPPYLQRRNTRRVIEPILEALPPWYTRGWRMSALVGRGADVLQWEAYDPSFTRHFPDGAVLVVLRRKCT